ncbi:hypothetical protein QBC41DRAFT_238427 [Cercophora samala]|uniref:CFEM domain-containing protein n=1 Tax=Cercophora samala TaxID=330535 RepID=A0AA39YKB7_9PEZI|nr:hypothetical protein QBC41DRAFT_238427 [Cercophora samala]
MMVSSTPTVAILLAAATAALALAPTPVLQHNARSEITPGPSCGEFPCGAELAAIPSCAVPCIESAGLGLGCGTTDYGCQCDNLDALQGAAVNCVIDGCGGFDNAIPVVYSAVAMCQCVGSNSPLPTPCPSSTSTTEEPVITEAPCGDFPCSAELEAIPACAVPCIENSGEKLGCGKTDYGCQCQNLDAIQGDAVMCVIDACGGFDNAIPVVYSAVAMCQCVASNTPLPTACPTTSTVETTTTSAAETSTAETSTIETSTVETSTVETSSIETTTVETSTTPSPSETETISTSDRPEESTTWDISTPPIPSITKPPTVTTTTSVICHTPCAGQASAIPVCATACIESAGGAVGCQRDDYSCQCASSNAIQATAVNCVLGACGGIPGAVKVVESVAAMCGCVSASGLSSCETTTRTITVGDGDDDGPAVTTTPGGSQPGSGFVSVTKSDGSGGGPVETPKPGDGDDGAGDDGGDGGNGDGDGGSDVVDGPGDDNQSQGPTPTSPRPPVVTAGASSNTLFIGASGLVGLLVVLAAFV